MGEGERGSGPTLNPRAAHLSSKSWGRRVNMTAKMQPVIVTLVHGTWARDARWTSDASSFVTKLVSAVDNLQIDRFAWSGRNTMQARKTAARDLADHIERLHNEQPSAAHYVIGHSHGGSVATQAYEHERYARLVDGVVTLSTPFLAARPRPTTCRNCEGAILAFALVSFTGALAALISFNHWDRWFFGLLPIVALLCFPITVGVFIEPAERIMNLLRMPRVPPERMLILRGAADEATGALGLAQFVTWVLNKSWSTWLAYVFAVHKVGDGIERRTARIPLLYRWFLVTVATIPLLLLIGRDMPDNASVWQLAEFFVAFGLPFAAGNPSAFIGGICNWLASVLAIPVLLLVSLTSLIALPFGGGAALGAFDLQMSVENVPFVDPPPERGYAVRVFGLPPNAPLLHSAIYDDVSVVHVVASWIGDHLRTARGSQQ